MEKTILVINPGSTSTKIAVFRGKEEVFTDTIDHSPGELQPFQSIIDQLDFRQRLIIEAVEGAGFQLTDFACLAARGGAGLAPLVGGTYTIDEEMVQDLREGKNGEHASNLAGIIAYNLAGKTGAQALTVDPVSVDEFEPLARLSGLPQLPRRSQLHALNLKAVARMAARDLGKQLEEINLIGVHLGGGISVAPIKKGKIIDVNNANQGGPYSPERTGTLPVLDLVEYIYREKPGLAELKRLLLGRGGLTAYLGTNDARLVEERIAAGDEKAELVYQGMIYQIAREIGGMAAVLQGELEAIFITGGLARSDYLAAELKKRTAFLAPLLVYPGSEEMKHLAAAALRVLNGEENALRYADGRVDTTPFRASSTSINTADREFNKGGANR